MTAPSQEMRLDYRHPPNYLWGTACGSSALIGTLVVVAGYALLQTRRGLPLPPAFAMAWIAGTFGAAAVCGVVGLAKVVSRTRLERVGGVVLYQDSVRVVDGRGRSSSLDWSEINMAFTHGQGTAQLGPRITLIPRQGAVCELAWGLWGWSHLVEALQSRSGLAAVAAHGKGLRYSRPGPSVSHRG